MRFLTFSVLFLSKFNKSHITCQKNSFFRFKSYTLQSTLSPVVFSPYRCFSVIKAYKTVSSSSVQFNNGKLFQETENEYAHQVMEKLSCYSNSLLKYPLQNESNVKTEERPGHSEVIDKFAEITLRNVFEEATLEDEKFTSLVRELCIALPEASDKSVKRVLHCLCMWPPTSSTTTQNFRSLWNLLDKECVKRMKWWDVSQKLLIGDYWFRLRLSRISHYNSALIYDLVKNIDSLSNHHIVQLMFYINLQRKIPDHFVPALEKKLESIINCLKLEELGIVCLGFFKTQNKISSVSLIQCIIKRFMNNVQNLNTLTVVAILKFLRKSRNTSLIDLYILTLHKCVSCLDNFDMPTSVHLALLSSECNVYHPLLLNCVSEKFAQNMDKVRIKDCAKFLLSLSLHNHCEGKFHNLFITELKKESRQKEVLSYPKHVVHSVLYYSYLGFYDYDLLAKVFQKEFVEECCLEFPELRPTFAEIDYSVEIECPDYKGPKLSALERKVLQCRRGNLPTKIQNANMQTRLISDIYNGIVEVLGSDKNVAIRHILPHVYSPDIIVRLSENVEESLANMCQSVSAELILKPPKNEVWAAFVVCGTYSFAYKSTQMSAIPSMKLRQLQKIGYYTTIIPYFNVSRNLSRRKDFLKEKLNTLKEEHQRAVSK